MPSGHCESLLYVGISGMVNKPGQLSLARGMTLRDLMRLARGPKIGAYLKDVELARLPADRSQGQLPTRCARRSIPPICSSAIGGPLRGPGGPAFRAVAPRRSRSSRSMRCWC